MMFNSNKRPREEATCSNNDEASSSSTATAATTTSYGSNGAVSTSFTIHNRNVRPRLSSSYDEDDDVDANNGANTNRSWSFPTE